MAAATPPREPEAYLAERIRQALAADPRVGELDVHVQITAGAAFVTGHVPTAERRDAVSAVAAEVAEDVPVHNEIEITPATAPDGDEILS